MGGVFLGYPAAPPGHAMRRFAELLRENDLARANTWEDLRPDGRLVIGEVLEAIDSAAMAVFDVTRPNPNVLFEIGYAIGRAKPLWLTLDSTDVRAKRAWVELGILKPLGYTEYRNSDELLRRFTESNPLENLAAAYDQLIEPTLPDTPRPRDSILYCKTFEPFEAANRLDGVVERRLRRGLRVTVSDPAESSLNPLTWYAPSIASAAGVLVHFSSDYRNQAEVHNNRHALVAGLALGLDATVLMLAEGDYPAPFDYETQLRKYGTPEECERLGTEWIDNLALEGPVWSAPRSAPANPLSRLRLGEHVAENERNELVDYFVETAAFRDVLAARDTLFVGHRGTGKTANAIEAYRTLAANKTCLAVLIKPASFEYSAMLAVVDRLPAYQHDYFFDALWRFVIQSEIASSLLDGLRLRSRYVPYSDEESGFLDYVTSIPFDLNSDVSVRLEQALDSLLERLGAEAPIAGTERNFVNEAFHEQAIAGMRARLGPLLKDKKRVAVFVDNLDKGWERGADFPTMARFILGLLTAQGRVVTDFERQDYWRDAIKLSVAAFLRSDIYTHLQREAREPDKLPISTIDWHDPATLLHVLESRFLASELAPTSAEALWTEYFPRTVEGVETRQFLVRVTLPRPRDLVYYCNSAVGLALDRGHVRVEEDDLVSARLSYSQYAYEALLVENGVTIPELKLALLAFLEAPGVATLGERKSMLIASGIAEDAVDRLLEKLLASSFLGLETSIGTFEFPEVGAATDKALALASKLEPMSDNQRTTIHVAFRPFLEIGQ